MRRDVFLDTSGLLALVNERDSLHNRAVPVLAELRSEAAPIVTSDWVLVELLSGASARALRTRAAEWCRSLVGSPDVEVVSADREGFLSALDLFESRPDKDWSLVDCSSILICKQRGIRRVFTHDRHFRQAGMQVLL